MDMAQPKFVFAEAEKLGALAEAVKKMKKGEIEYLWVFLIA